MTVELDDEAVELILREGFCPEYGARNLERVMDRMLGGPLAEAILGGEATGKKTLKVSVVDGHLEFQWKSLT